MTIKMIALSVVALALTAPGFSQELSAEEQAYLDALEKELPGTLMNNPIEISLQTFGEDYRAKVVKADIPGGAAYQVRVRKAKQQPWDISVTGALTDGVETGDTVTVAFWARAAKPDEKTGKGHLQLRVQQKSAPYSGVLEETVDISQDWQMYELSAAANHSFRGDEMSIAFNIGDHEQTLEFGPFYVLNMGQDES